MVRRGGGGAWRGAQPVRRGVSAVLSAGVYLPAQSQLPALEPLVLWPWLCEPLAFMEELGRVAASFCSLAPLVAHPWPEPRSSGTLPLTISLPLQSILLPTRPQTLPTGGGPRGESGGDTAPQRHPLCPSGVGGCGEPSPRLCSPR